MTAAEIAGTLSAAIDRDADLPRDRRGWALCNRSAIHDAASSKRVSASAH